MSPHVRTVSATVNDRGDMTDGSRAARPGIDDADDLDDEPTDPRFSLDDFFFPDEERSP